ncbi:MAG: PP2C family protein-serine/threonine phosphatase [Kineosporiaceae bacterium]
MLLPVLVIAIILTADVLEGPKTAFLGLLAVTPMLSAVFGSPRCAAFVGAIALAAGWTFGHVAADGNATAQHIRLAAIAIFSVVATVAAGARLRTQERAARADDVVAAVAAAITRPLPRTVAGYRVAARYHGAEHEAQVGGDFYEVLATDAGLRLVLGDVRGKGLAAVRLSNYATGAFREAARSRGQLHDVVAAMDAVLRLDGGPEDFATALVAEVRDGALWAISCGHPAPALVRNGTVTWLEAPVDVPLGLGAGTMPAAAVARGPAQVLLVTDGLLEARDRRGRFFDADAALRRIVADSGGHTPEGDALLAAMARAVRRHAGQLRDDVALLTLALP